MNKWQNYQHFSIKYCFLTQHSNNGHVRCDWTTFLRTKFITTFILEFPSVPANSYPNKLIFRNKYLKRDEFFDMVSVRWGSPHFDLKIRHIFHDTIPHRLKERSEEWPPCSPDFFLCFLWEQKFIGQGPKKWKIWKAKFDSKLIESHQIC